jgi:hypothetical protein
MGWTSGLQCLAGAMMRFFSLRHHVQTCFGAHPASCAVGTRVFPQRWSSRDVKLTTHLHLVPTLRMHGAVPLLPQYAFTACCLIKQCILHDVVLSKAQGQLYFYLTYNFIERCWFWMHNSQSSISLVQRTSWCSGYYSFISVKAMVRTLGSWSAILTEVVLIFLSPSSQMLGWYLKISTTA